MTVHKRKYRSGKVVWFYQFDIPGSTRTTRLLIKGSGFATKGEATDAEAARRIEEQQKLDLAKRGAWPSRSRPHSKCSWTSSSASMRKRSSRPKQSSVTGSRRR